jgi:hypothetical protein
MARPIVMRALSSIGLITSRVQARRQAAEHTHAFRHVRAPGLQAELAGRPAATGSCRHYGERMLVPGDVTAAAGTAVGNASAPSDWKRPLDRGEAIRP